MSEQSTQIFWNAEPDLGFRAKWYTGRVLIYGALILWALICLFPIYWTVTTSFKIAPDVMRGHLVPWGDFEPQWRGWRSLGLSPNTISETSTVREEFLKRFRNSVVISLSASMLAVMLGSLAAYGLSRFSYRFGFMRNSDISFFFLSQMILPPVVLALPFLILYKELALLDSRIGIILLYTLMVLPIVIWIMRDQFSAIPVELEEAALVDGLSIWGVLPDRAADRPSRHGRRLYPVAGAVLERVFFRGPSDLYRCQDAAGHGGQPDRQPRHQLVVHGRTFGRRHRATGGYRNRARALHHQGDGIGGREVSGRAVCCHVGLLSSAAMSLVCS